jgi:hypothetical protein
MPNTFELIASSTVGSGGAANIDFTSIPATYTDLVVKLSGRSTYSGAGVADYAVISFNGVTTNQTIKYLYGTGSAAGSVSDTSIYAPVNTSAQTSNTFGSTEYYVPNYLSSNNKSVSAEGVSENNATAAGIGLIAGLWSSTATINRITLTPANGSFVQYSTAYLYGVKNA